MDWFVNSTISAEMAENPSVMTAAGWRKDSKTGKMQLWNKIRRGSRGDAEELFDEYTKTK